MLYVGTGGREVSFIGGIRKYGDNVCVCVCVCVCVRERERERNKH